MEVRVLSSAPSLESRIYRESEAARSPRRGSRRGDPHLGRRPPREEPRGHDVGAVPLHASPFYAGSAIITLGFVIASRSWLVALLAAAYLALSYTAAIRREEAFLTAEFGAAYPEYKAGRVGGVARTFSVDRAMRNREYRAVAGLAAALAVLAVKVTIR